MYLTSLLFGFKKSFVKTCIKLSFNSKDLLTVIDVEQTKTHTTLICRDFIWYVIPRPYKIEHFFNRYSLKHYHFILTIWNTIIFINNVINNKAICFCPRIQIRYIHGISCIKHNGKAEKILCKGRLQRKPLKFQVWHFWRYCSYFSET